ncbi:MAG: type I DNA topoisomerase [Ruminococcaceae bacterium]|nr:type I DNA topoisomerase [Oscillospiraceae bacterium]
MANLVILESPSKAATVKNYLGSGYKVVACQGHVRDLPKSSLGVDIENDFEPHYINIRGKGDLIASLKKDAKAANKIYLATDPDREGEAIAWHLANALGIPIEQTKRVTFNAVTKPVVKAAIKNPRNVDIKLVDSQQARRILDRIVGYKLSPFLWKAVKSGLSAGRVQSVATKIIVERENEIRGFVPEEYWLLDAYFKNSAVKAKFYGKSPAQNKLELKNEAQTYDVISATQNAEFTVKTVKRSVRLKSPAPPFNTSSMQQEAAKKLNFQSQYTMRIAQELYEGINLGAENGGTHGLITYMRTDSLRISPEGASEAKAYIGEKYGEKYLPSQPRVYKSKDSAQDAHEAIRPADVTLEPDAVKKYLSSGQYKLYKLIWSRFVASQMANAEFDTVTADIEAAGYIFRTSGNVVRFNGYMAVYITDDGEGDEDEAENRLPDLKEGEKMELKELLPTKKFTEPPARYNEATIIKFLEENGIGRPSTFAQIISTIISRGYVKRDKHNLVPTALGEITTTLMENHFHDIVDYKFTARMEDSLDSIADGQTTMKSVLGEFYKGFAENLEKAEAEIKNMSIDVPAEQTNIICDKCGATMIVKNGRFGKFAACPNYPECKNTKPLDSAGKPKAEVQAPEETGLTCETCGGKLVIRNGKFGNFYACENFPKCKFTKQITKEIGIPCPKCGASIVTKKGRNNTFFYSCEKYPECNFSSWDQPLRTPCPDCGSLLMKKKGKNTVYCLNKESCAFTASADDFETDDE